MMEKGFVGSGGSTYERQYRRLDRRRALAEALANQAAGPSSYQQQMIPGPYGPVVASSPIAGGIEKAGYLLGSAIAGRGADEEENRIGAAQRAATAEWAARAFPQEGGPPMTQQQRLALGMEAHDIGGGAAAAGASFLKPPEFERIDLKDRAVMVPKGQAGEFKYGLSPDTVAKEAGDDRRFLGVSGNTKATIEGHQADIVSRGEQDRMTRQTPSVSVSYSHSDPASLAIQRDRLTFDKSKAAGGVSPESGYAPPEGYEAVKMQKPMTASKSVDVDAARVAAENTLAVVDRQDQLYKDLAKKYGNGVIGRGAAWIGANLASDELAQEYVSNQKQLVQEGLAIQKGVQTEGDALRQEVAGMQFGMTEAAHKAVADRARRTATRAAQAADAQAHGYVLSPKRGDKPASPATPAGAGAMPGGVKRISSDAEFDSLPSGAEFIDPDGKRRRKP